MTRIPQSPAPISHLSRATTPGHFASMGGQDYTADAISGIVRSWQGLQLPEDKLVFLNEVEDLSGSGKDTALCMLALRVRLGLQAALGKLCETARQKIAPFSRANTYAEWKYQCESHDLSKTLERLKTISELSTDSEMQDAFTKFCRERSKQLLDTDLDFVNDPESVSNKLLIDIAALLFPIRTLGELVCILYPDVKYTYELLAAKDGKLHLSHTHLTKSANTTAAIPLEARHLAGLLVLGDTAIFVQDHAEIRAFREKQARVADFWQPMQLHSPGLFEKLTASDKALQNLAEDRQTLSTTTASLRTLLEKLAKGFLDNSAHGGSGTDDVASPGAGLALELFERDWSLFADLHKSEIGQQIQNILKDVRARKCVASASQAIQTISRSTDPVLAQTRPRPAESSSLPNLLLTESPQRLPSDLARLCGPEASDYDTLLPYLLEMPASTYYLLLQNLSLLQLFNPPPALTEPLSDLQRKAFHEAIDTGLTNNRDTLKTHLLEKDKDGSSPIASIARGENQEGWQSILNLFTNDLETLKTHLLEKDNEGRSPIFYIARRGKQERWHSILSLFTNDLETLKSHLLEKDKDGRSPIFHIARNGKQEGWQIILNLFTGDLETLKSHLLEKDKDGRSPIFYIERDGTQENWQKILNLFTGDLETLKSHLLKKEKDYRSSFLERWKNRLELLVSSVLSP